MQLKLSISRLRMVQQKDTAIAKQQRRAMAQLLEVQSKAFPGFSHYDCLLISIYNSKAKTNLRASV